MFQPRQAPRVSSSSRLASSRTSGKHTSNQTSPLKLSTIFALAPQPNSFDTNSHELLLSVHQHSIGLEEGCSFKIRVFLALTRITKVLCSVLPHPRRGLVSPSLPCEPAHHASLSADLKASRYILFPFFTVSLIEFHVCYQIVIPDQVLRQKTEVDAEAD
jgi:hypothetical protein